MKLENDIFKMLYKNSVRAIPLGFFVAALLATDLWLLNISLQIILPWLAAVIVVNLVRLYHLKLVYSKRYFEENKKLSVALIIAFSGLSGIVWGSSYLLIASSLTGVQEAVIILVLGGISAGAIASYAVYLPAYYSFMLPILVPTAIVYLWGFSTNDLILAAILSLYILLLVMTAKSFSKLTKKALTLNNKKIQLVDKLSITNKNLKEAYMKIEKISKTDALTELPNRRYFDEVLATEWRRAIRYKTNLSLLIVDVDNFKTINDKMGHRSGDHYLKGISKSMKNCLHRPGDYIARIGGDEFAIILANTDIDEAYIVADTLRKEITKFNKEFQTPENSCVSISIGVSSLHGDQDKETEIDALIVSADKALYKAKSLGKNQVSL